MAVARRLEQRGGLGSFWSGHRMERYAPCLLALEVPPQSFACSGWLAARVLLPSVPQPCEHSLHPPRLSGGRAQPAGAACLRFCICAHLVLAAMLMPPHSEVSVLRTYICWPVCRRPQVCADQCCPGWRLQLLCGSA